MTRDDVTLDDLRRRLNEIDCQFGIAADSGAQSHKRRGGPA